MDTDELLPTKDPVLRDPELDLDALEAHWARYGRRAPMSGEQMRGADARAQRLGVSGDRLMEEAGSAVAAVARALLRSTDRSDGPILVLGGPGNNGGDGWVAARHLAGGGSRVLAVLVASGQRPTAGDAARDWERLAGMTRVERMHAATVRDVRIVMAGVERAALLIDALLGTGVRGTLREPIRTAVDLTLRAREAAVPILSVDTPTVVDLTSGVPSDPVVRADVTVTFHRPKQGLLTRVGGALAGRVLVAPIGIPSAADPT